MNQSTIQSINQLINWSNVWWMNQRFNQSINGYKVYHGLDVVWSTYFKGSTTRCIESQLLVKQIHLWKYSKVFKKDPHCLPFFHRVANSSQTKRRNKKFHGSMRARWPSSSTPSSKKATNRATGTTSRASRRKILSTATTAWTTIPAVREQWPLPLRRSRHGTRSSHRAVPSAAVATASQLIHRQQHCWPL